MMAILMPEWDGTKESAEWAHAALNAVVDVLVNAGMWTGDPPYQGKTPAEQVQMLVERDKGAPIVEISRLVSWVEDEWGETEPTNIVGAWLDKREKSNDRVSGS